MEVTLLVAGSDRLARGDLGSGGAVGPRRGPSRRGRRRFLSLSRSSDLRVGRRKRSRGPWARGCYPVTKKATESLRLPQRTPSPFPPPFLPAFNSAARDLAHESIAKPRFDAFKKYLALPLKFSE